MSVVTRLVVQSCFHLSRICWCNALGWMDRALQMWRYILSSVWPDC